MGWTAAVGLAQAAHTHYTLARSTDLASAIPLYGKLVPTAMGMGDRAQGICGNGAELGDRAYHHFPLLPHLLL